MSRRLLEAGSGSRTEAFGAQEWLLLAGIALIWGSSFLFIDIGLEAFRPGVVALARLGLGVAAVALFPAARRHLDRADLPQVALLGLIWAGLPLVLFPVAQQWIDSSVAGMLNGAVPLFGAAWAVLLLRRPLGRIQTLGLLVGFAGVMAISWPELRGSRATTVGAALVLGAVACYGAGRQPGGAAAPALRRPAGAAARPARRRGAAGAVRVMEPARLAAGVGTGAGHAAAGDPWHRARVRAHDHPGRSGRRPRGAVATYFIPVVAIALGVVVLGERVAPAALVGTALVLGGAWLTSRREARPAP
jgi:drug/metabolite transporter (DMT)-like permease